MLSAPPGYYLSCKADNYHRVDVSATPTASLQLWNALLRASSLVLAELDRRLRADLGINVREFDVLVNLDQVPGERMRMTDLANAVLLSSGGLTRLVGRLEGRGLLRRDPDPRDGRGYLASLTPAGRAQLAAARAVHDAIIEDMLAAHFDERHVREHIESLRAVTAQLHPDGSTDRTPGSDGRRATRLRSGRKPAQG
jgi:DNA-binding MarR family transcriptional regulator